MKCARDAATSLEVFLILNNDLWMTTWQEYRSESARSIADGVNQSAFPKCKVCGGDIDVFTPAQVEAFLKENYSVNLRFFVFSAKNE